MRMEIVNSKNQLKDFMLIFKPEEQWLMFIIFMEFHTKLLKN